MRIHTYATYTAIQNIFTQTPLINNRNIPTALALVIDLFISNQSTIVNILKVHFLLYSIVDRSLHYQRCLRILEVNAASV